MTFHIGNQWNETVLMYAGKGAGRHLESVTIYHGVYTEIDVLIWLIIISGLLFYVYMLKKEVSEMACGGSKAKNQKGKISLSYTLFRLSILSVIIQIKSTSSNCCCVNSV